MVAEHMEHRSSRALATDRMPLGHRRTLRMKVGAKVIQNYHMYFYLFVYFQTQIGPMVPFT
jgi:hypothetical protein